MEAYRQMKIVLGTEMINMLKGYTNDAGKLSTGVLSVM
jgi:hypothetical protein